MVELRETDEPVDVYGCTGVSGPAGGRTLVPAYTRRPARTAVLSPVPQTLYMLTIWFVWTAGRSVACTGVYGPL